MTSDWIVPTDINYQPCCSDKRKRIFQVRHLDIDSPELVRHDRADDIDDTFLARTSSASKDPGTVGPIVWNLNKRTFSIEGIIYYFIIFTYFDI